MDAKMRHLPLQITSSARRLLDVSMLYRSYRRQIILQAPRPAAASLDTILHNIQSCMQQPTDSLTLSRSNQCTSSRPYRSYICKNSRHSAPTPAPPVVVSRPLTVFEFRSRHESALLFLDPTSAAHSCHDSPKTPGRATPQTVPHHFDCSRQRLLLCTTTPRDHMLARLQRRLG